MGGWHPGFVVPYQIHALLDSQDIPGKRRKLAVERTVLASVNLKVIYFMHRVRFGGLYGRQKAEKGHQSSTSDTNTTDEEELQTTLSQQRQRFSPTVAAALTSCSSANDDRESVSENPLGKSN